MNSEHHHHLERAIRAAGGVCAISNACGLSHPYVSLWRKSKKGVPAEHCRAIEAATGGRVTRYQLRPDVFGDGPEAEGLHPREQNNTSSDEVCQVAER